MARNLRATNLDLLRWRSGTHERVAKKLAHLTNSKYLSDMATGKRQVTDGEAREIERSFKLPERWLDRDNLAALTMTDSQARILVALTGLNPISIESLATFLEKLRE